MSEDSKQVLAITQSMTKRQNVTKPNENKSNDQATAVFEQLSGFSTKVPKLITVLNVHELKINAHMKHDKIFGIRADVNEVLPLDAILSSIERTSSQRNISELQMRTDDKIFEYCTAEEFKNACMKTLKNVQMALIHPVTRIDDENEQMKLIREYHSDRIGGHCGQKRLYARLRDQFYWRDMTRDIAKFVKNCKECMLSKLKMGRANPWQSHQLQKEPYNKFKEIYSGPYRVRQISEHKITIEINNKPYEIHKNRVVKC